MYEVIKQHGANSHGLVRIFLVKMSGSKVAGDSPEFVKAGHFLVFEHLVSYAECSYAVTDSFDLFSRP